VDYCALPRVVQKTVVHSLAVSGVIADIPPDADDAVGVACLFPALHRARMSRAGATSGRTARA
jgi:hypothetical protein